MKALVPRKCVDYIFCSASTLQTREVFAPPCRALVAANAGHALQRPSTHPFLATPETLFPLAARIGMRRRTQLAVGGDSANNTLLSKVCHWTPFSSLVM